MRKQKKKGRLKKEPKVLYPFEDRVLKDAARFMGEELFPFLGITGKIRRAAPTEAVFLEISDFLADFNYEMEDGSWIHLEFETDSISADDLRRFRACEAVISYNYKVEVSTCVLCTSRVKVLQDCLSQGFNTYQVKVIRMKDHNADQVIPRLEEAQQKKGYLERHDLLYVLLTPLMDGTMSQAARVRRIFRILQKESGNQNVKDEELLHMQSVIYALAMKFLTEDELKKTKEMISMTLLGQMLMEDGIEKGMEKGIEKGEFKNLQELVSKNFLSVQTAAASKNMTVEEFWKKLKDLKLV